MLMLLDPAILFFVFGIFAGLVKSNLQIPEPVSKFLSLYLLMALGIKGGAALQVAGFSWSIVTVLGIGLLLALVIPAVHYAWLRTQINSFDAAAVAATYGSVSAVTFVTATQMLGMMGIEFTAAMAAVMALMESPAIIMAVALAAWSRKHDHVSLGHVLRESFTDGAHLLLLAALVIGLVSTPAGLAAITPFTGDLFKGMLAFFLLDMGLKVAARLADVKTNSASLIAFALLAPLLHAGAALVLCAAAGVSMGNAILLMVLAASASYIAVPAVVREAIPEANPTIYFGLSVAITFPFNILVGIPLYVAAAGWLLG